MKESPVEEQDAQLHRRHAASVERLEEVKLLGEASHIAGKLFIGELAAML